MSDFTNDVAKSWDALQAARAARNDQWANADPAVRDRLNDDVAVATIASTEAKERQRSFIMSLSPAEYEAHQRKFLDGLTFGRKAREDRWT